MHLFTLLPATLEESGAEPNAVDTLDPTRVGVSSVHHFVE